MKEMIIDLIKEKGPLSYGEILSYINCGNDELAKEIFNMEDIDIIKIGKLYNLIDGVNFIRGTIVIRNDNPYLKTNADSLYVAKKYLGNAFDKDIVIATVHTDYYGRKEARVYKVVSHSNLELVAKMTKRVYRNEKIFKVVDPNSNYEFISVKQDKLNGAHPKDICILEIKYKGEEMIASVKKIIGHESDIGSDVLALVASAKVPYIFNDNIYEEVNKINNEVLKEELVGRVDFTQDLVITIDGDDSKDFDDAVNLKILPNGNYLLAVHIADVSHYVKEYSQIDQEALRRGTSIYLADRVIPMLPEKLSNGICSLNEGVVRLVLSCLMEFDSSGRIINSSIKSGYIKSKHRMTYSNVNKIFEGNEALIKKYSDIYPMLLNMKDLSLLLRGIREERGGLDFDIKEMKIIVDEKGVPINVESRERGLSEMMIEDFMLAANEAVAETLFHLKYPCCYRVHEEPNKERLANVNNILKAIGEEIKNIDKGVKPKQLQRLMNNIKGTAAEDSVNTLLLRAMAKARYDSMPLGHYGLAAQYYCHFTSPIRRYPDLQTHRMITDLLINKNNIDESLNHYNSILDNVCSLSSDAERRAVDLERMVNDMKAAEYMMDKVGNIYNAVISSVTSFGLFVMLENTIEGLVHVKNLPDFYIYDEKMGTLTGNYSKVVYNIGDRIKVKLIGASKETRQIDFMLVPDNYKRSVNR